MLLTMCVPYTTLCYIYSTHTAEFGVQSSESAISGRIGGPDRQAKLRTCQPVLEANIFGWSFTHSSRIPFHLQFHINIAEDPVEVVKAVSPDNIGSSDEESDQVALESNDQESPPAVLLPHAAPAGNSIHDIHITSIHLMIDNNQNCIFNMLQRWP